MESLFIFIFIIILFVYGGFTYYIGLKGLKIILSSGLNFSPLSYWIIIWIIAFAFFIARGANKWLPNWLAHFLETIGAYWLGAITYLVIISVLSEFVILLNNRLEFIPDNWIKDPKLPLIIGIITIFFVLSLIFYGVKSAGNPQLTKYEVNLHKKIDKYDELNIALVSDLHLGKFVNKRQLEKIVEKINQLNTDIVVIPGDIIDDRIDFFISENMMEVFQRLNPPLGIYASMGNHEYIGGQVEMIEKYFQEAGINLLRDEYVKISDSFYIVGREDKAYERFKKRNRKSIKELLEGVDKSLPIIMLDHQPVDIYEASEEGVDIQLSGHTHRGQFFPFGIFTKKFFMIDWGYKKFGNLHVIVTSGGGTWGPPMRLGSFSEIVHIKVKFQ